MWSQDFIAVDWGTTNRRAWLVAANGAVEAEFSDSMGLLSVPQNGFDQAAADIRAQLGDHPMLLAGMVGSDRGWRNAPYVSVPADTASLAAHLLWIDELTAIVPGVCQSGDRPDVMRGEEVQALGASAQGSVGPDALLCHPGTHNKWLRLQGWKIDHFQTMMTGELFNLLREHSIIAPQLGGHVSDGDAFRAGLREAASGAPLLASLFALRARYVLRQAPSADASFASGLLIGGDVQAGLRHATPGETIGIVGEEELCELYAIAIGEAGFEVAIIDADSAFLSGIQSIRKTLETA